MIQSMTSADNFGWETANLSRTILESWQGLEMVYKIPKRVRSEIESDVSSSTVDLKRHRTSEDYTASPPSVGGATPSNYRPSLSQTAFRSSQSPHSFSHSLSPAPNQEADTSIVRVVEDQPRLAWNHIIPLKMESEQSINRVSSPSVETSTQSMFGGLSESSIEQMVEAAQKASQAKQEEEKRKQLRELEEQKRRSKLDKKQLKSHKKEQRALSQTLAGKIIERAKKEQMQTPSTPTTPAAVDSNVTKASTPTPEISAEDRKQIKANVISF